MCMIVGSKMLSKEEVEEKKAREEAESKRALAALPYIVRLQITPENELSEAQRQLLAMVAAKGQGFAL